jgi:type IV pilus assembly protein PilE
MKLNKKGFTLVELLVVVLIIGVLAAIALPQYRKAVLKSKYVSLFHATNALAQAQEEYYLINGVYANDLNKLSITVPNINGFHFRLWPADNPVIITGVANGAIAYEVGFKYTRNGLRQCRAAVASPRFELAKQVCKEITGRGPRDPNGDGFYVTYPYGNI